MHELPLLINIAVALVVAFFGGMIARRVGLPTLVGYMLAGIAIGPFTPGFVGDVKTISQLAELGVIFLTNPDPREILRANDLVGLVGDEKQLNAAQKVLASSGDGGR